MHMIIYTEKYKTAVRAHMNLQRVLKVICYLPACGTYQSIC